MNGTRHFLLAEDFARDAAASLERSDFDAADTNAALANAHAQLAAIAFNVSNLLGTGEGGSQDSTVREANAIMRDSWRDTVDSTVDQYVVRPSRA